MLNKTIGFKRSVNVQMNYHTRWANSDSGLFHSKNFLSTLCKFLFFASQCKQAIEMKKLISLLILCIIVFGKLRSQYYIYPTNSVTDYITKLSAKDGEYKKIKVKCEGKIIADYGINDYYYDNNLFFLGMAFLNEKSSEKSARDSLLELFPLHDISSRFVLGEVALYDSTANTLTVRHDNQETYDSCKYKFDSIGRIIQISYAWGGQVYGSRGSAEVNYSYFPQKFLVRISHNFTTKGIELDFTDGLKIITEIEWNPKNKRPSKVTEKKLGSLDFSSRECFYTNKSILSFIKQIEVKNNKITEQKIIYYYFSR